MTTITLRTGASGNLTAAQVDANFTGLNADGIATAAAVLTKADAAATTSALAGKQATLVSGTSIKTVGGVNLLGAGDVPVTTTLVGATDYATANIATGNAPLAAALGTQTTNIAANAAAIATKADATATTTALAGKQATLVSNTNIKTVGGTSLLGSGDIALVGTTSPVTLSANTNLTAAAHGNRTIFVDTASLTLTINNDATGGWTAGSALYIEPVGSGSFTLVQGTATLSTPAGSSAASATAVSGIVGADRRAADTWLTTSAAVAVSNATPTYKLSPVAYFGPRSFGDNQFGASGANTLNPSIITTSPVATFGTPSTADGSFGGWIRARLNCGGTTANTYVAGLLITGSGVKIRMDNTGSTNGRFPVRFPFAIGATSGTDCRVFVGLTASPGASDYTGDPSSRTGADCFAVIADSADANLSVMWNDNAGAVTKVTLGANFPKTVNIPFHVEFNVSAGVPSVTIWNRANDVVATQVMNDANAPRTTLEYGFMAFAANGPNVTNVASFDVGIGSIGGV